MHRAGPVLAFAPPGPAVEIEAGFVGRTIVTAIPLAPAQVIRVMFGAAEGPHVVQGPDDGFLDPTDVRNREHLAGDPVHVDDVGVRGVEIRWPA